MRGRFYRESRGDGYPLVEKSAGPCIKKPFQPRKIIVSQVNRGEDFQIDFQD